MLKDMESLRRGSECEALYLLFYCRDTIILALARAHCQINYVRCVLAYLSIFTCHN